MDLAKKKKKGWIWLYLRLHAVHPTLTFWWSHESREWFGLQQ